MRKKFICYMLFALSGAIIDKLLVKAYDNGIVCSGLSVGSYCWFKYNYDLIEGLNVINAINFLYS